MQYSNFSFRLQILFYIVLTAGCFAQSAVPETTPVPLKLNVPVEGIITEGGTQSFALHLESNKIATLMLEQKNASLELIVDDAKSNTRLIEMNANYGSFGYERVLFESENEPRDLLVKVSRFTNDYGKGGFSLNLSEMRTAEANDKIRIAAQDLFLKGSNLSLSYKESREQARIFYEDALKLVRQSGDKSLEVSILTLLQIVYQYNTNYKKAGECGNDALALLTGQENSYPYTRVKYATGYDFVNAGEPEKGVEVLSKVLVRTREIGDRKLEVLTLNTLSYGYMRLNENVKSIEYAKQAYEIAKNNNDNASQTTSLLNLSYIYTDQGDFFEAIENLKIALPIAEKSADLRMISRIYNQLGTEYLALGQIQKALDYQQQSLSLKITLGDKFGEAIVLANIASDYSSMGQNLRALEYNRRAVKIYTDLGDKDSIGRALSLAGTIYWSLRDYPKAKETFVEALKITENRNLRSQTAAIYHSLGFTEYRLNNFQAAADNFNKAIQIKHDLKMKRAEAASLSALADTYITLGQFEKAAEAADKSLEIFRAVGDRPLESNALYNLARIKRNQKDLTAALGHIENSIKIIDQLRADLISQENRATYFSTVRYKYEFYISLLVELGKQSGDKKYTAEAFAASERARGRSLLDLLAESNTDVSAGLSPELKSREQSIRAKLSTLQTRLIGLKSAEKPDAPRIANLQKDIDQADDEREQLETEIRRANPRYAELKYPTTLNLTQIQAVLDEKTVLLEYQMGANASFLFAVGKKDFQVVSLPGERNLRQAIESLRQSISAPTRAGLGNYLVNGRELYQTLLAPVQLLLKNKTKIIVSADGALNYLPFEILLTDNQEASLDKLPYLVRDFEISYTPSASVLVNLGEAEKRAKIAKPEKSFLAFAAPDYEAKNNGPEQLASLNTRAVFGADRSWNLADLPYAKTEAERIAKLFPAGQATVLTGSAATEERAQSNELSQYRYLHFAVHGLIDEEQPQFSSLVLSLPKRDSQSTTQNSQSAESNANPKSKIENPKSAEDGLLQTPEIFNLRLRADLVTLSACETGLGKEIRGEGIVGLTRAFFYAGTPLVLVSLWKVNDASTADLMTYFYENLRKNSGSNKSAALRQAQLKMIAGNRYAHPYYWAPFVLQGKTSSNF